MPELSAMRLVGGTALALLLGHRKSIDLDFFGTFDSSIRFVDLLRERGFLAAAKAASRDAVAKAFAAGLSITVLKNGKLVRIAPDRTETAIDG